MDSSDLSALNQASLKDLRVGRGRTHQDVAEETGMHRPNVVRLERKEALRAARVTTLVRMLEALDYDLVLLAVPRDSDKRGAKIVELVDALDADAPRAPKRRSRRR
jgi:transcriptional regulator with XRE-family HTH domain